MYGQRIILGTLLHANAFTFDRYIMSLPGRSDIEVVLLSQILRLRFGIAVWFVSNCNDLSSEHTFDCRILKLRHDLGRDVLFGYRFLD